MQKEKILVIDDEEFILQLSRDILTKINYEVKTVSDGNEGMKLLENEKFDLLFTDIRMPDSQRTGCDQTCESRQQGDPDYHNYRPWHTRYRH